MTGKREGGIVLKKISLVIPCYYSEKSLPYIVEESIKTLSEARGYEYEIILVNDGSKDGTWNVIKECAEENPHIIGINLSRNFGQHNAMMAGYRAVSGDIVVGLDDDGENNPKDMFLLIDELENSDCDFVCASYDTGKERSLFRSFGTAANAFMAETLIDKPKGIEITSFYCMRRFVVDQIITNRNPYPYIAGLVLQASRNFSTVPMEMHQRLYGKSNYNLRKLLRLWLNGFTAFSVKPLRISAILGVVVSLAGFLYGLFIILRRIANPDSVVVGFSSVMASLWFIGGVLMIILGMIGEYVGRIYLNINSLPQYVVREVYCRDEQADEKVKGSCSQYSSLHTQRAMKSHITIIEETK